MMSILELWIETQGNCKEKKKKRSHFYPIGYIVNILETERKKNRKNEKKFRGETKT